MSATEKSTERTGTRASHLLGLLQALARNLGRTPTQADLLSAGVAPMAYYRAFGNLPEAQRLAGLTPHRTHWTSKRRARCRNGHAYTPENTQVYCSTRGCKKCLAAARTRYEAKRGRAK